VGTIAVGERNKILDAVVGRTAYTEPTDCYVQLHTGDPVAAGTSNVATESDRVQATFGNAASSGAISNTVAVEWTNVAATETYTHISLWSASSAGTFVGSDDLSSSAAVTAGDTFRIPIGDLDLTLT
jgi:hypothetical protein